MHDDLNPGARREISTRVPAQPQTRETDPRIDREVPHLSKDVQDWLDGDATEPSMSEATAKQVELWKKIGTDANARRQITTPSHVQQAIMAALPNVARADALPWWRRSMSLSPVVVSATAAALVAAGAAIGAALFAR